MRALDADDLVAWLEQAPEVAIWFARLIGKLPDGSSDILSFMNRQESLHIDTRSTVTRHTTAIIADLRSSMPSALAEAMVLAGLAEPGTLLDPADRELEAKINVARDLIKRGFVRSARADLEQLKNEAGAIPEELEFRIVTNLGVCALADEDIDGACALLEEAHRLQPENQKGISNAALAARLRNDSERAVELALKARASNPRDSQATAVLIGGLWDASEGERLEELVDSEEWITRDQNCALVLAQIRMQQSRFEEAATLCRSLIDVDPEDGATHLALSECLLSYAQGDRFSVGYMGKSLALLSEAEAAATRAINLLQPTQLKAHYWEALVIRAAARGHLGATAAMMRDLDEVLGEASTHPYATFNKGLFLLNEGRPAEARAVFESIQDPGRYAEAAIPLAEACLASGDAEAVVKLLRNSLTLEHPGWKEVRRAEILTRAEARVGNHDSVGPALEVALERDPDSPLLLALAAVRCEILGDPEGAEESLLNALNHADEPDRQEILIQLGALYQGLSRYAEAADRFIEVVDEAPWHPGAIPLLVCLVNGKRLREALGWARRIREGHPQPPRIAIEVEARILDHVGDVCTALSRYEDLCSLTDSTPVDQVKLALAQFRCSERDAALKTVLGINASHLQHDPPSILALAQLKLLLGESGYLDDAYLARRCGLNDPAVQLGYFGLFLGRDREWVEPETVGPGCAVLLKNESAKQWWRILDDREESLGSHELFSTDELTRQLLGRRAGDTVVLRKDFEDLSYEIEAVQSKFVRAFQETVEEFSTRFPGNTGLSRVKVTDDDFTKVFLSVDRRDQLVRQAERMYREGRLPFASFSSLLGLSVLEVWRGCTQNDSTRIRFGIGATEEADEASSLLCEADGVVLDLLALLTVHELGLAAHLRSRFPRVAVPQHVIDDLQNTAYATIVTGSASGGLGKGSDGRYTLTEMSEEDWTRWQEYVRSVLEFAESFERIASYRMLDANDVENLVDALTTAGVGAVYAGDEQPTGRLVLVSDDLLLCSFARSLRIDAVNTQAVLWELHRSDVVAGEAYSSWIERLALLNYWFVRVRPEDIVQRLEVNGYVTTDGTRAMLKTLEGPDCSLDSAISVGAAMITAVAGSAPRWQAELILLLVLVTLQRGRERSPVLLKFRNEIASRLALAPLIRNQLLQTVDLYNWTVGRSLLR